MKAVESTSDYLLGIDMGVRSLGWAALDLHGNTQQGVRAAGVRCFAAGVEGDVEKGRDQSRAAMRREPRQQRRQIWRRAYRKRKVLRVLQRHGLLPAAPVDDPQQIHEFIAGIDADLRSKHVSDDDAMGHQTLLYRLRAKALDEPLELVALGRVFYHLAQRRGFNTDQRKDQDTEDESGKVREGITKLREAMDAAGSRTLGEYFSTLNPHEQRIRQRWTARWMYRDEFDAIWEQQAEHHEQLDDAFRKELSDAIFFQRPLKSQAHLIGRCGLIDGRRRAPLACLTAQRFRMLAAVNNLAFRRPGQLDQPLEPDQRRMLIDALDRDGDLTFGKIRKLLRVKSKFNLEEGGEKRVPGNRTESKLRPIFGTQWDTFTERRRDEIIDDLLGFESKQALVRHAKSAWGLDAERAKELAETHLERDRARFCREAMRRLLRHMEEGVHVQTARQREFPESFRGDRVHDVLPPVLDSMTDLRNPAVIRSLSELRKVVNAAIRAWGKPACIRVELARDLKNPRKKREQATKNNRANQKAREEAKARILREMPAFGEPRRSDIEKVLLAEECGWTCPFTGRGICMATLLGANAEFDIEHILPFSRTLDNRYPNKTLCHVDENRHRKRNRTPFEAYGGTPQYEEILQRVKAFKGNMARAKLARFKVEQLSDEFVEAQLQDTRYASRLAGQYLALLYGGRSDDDGTLRVQVSPGGATAFLRNEWQLNSILDDGGEKTRTNHKHHAVDAIATALTSPAMVKRLADAAERRFEAGRRLFAPIPVPWDGFVDDVRSAIDAINVSHRVNHKLGRGKPGPNASPRRLSQGPSAAGALHQETNYSKPHRHKGQGGRDREYRHIRKPVASLSRKEVDAIVDGRVREHVRAKLADVGGDPKKLEDNWPTLPTRDGRAIPIRKVRIRTARSVIAVGMPECPRYVAPGNNHHTVIVARKDKKGRVKWEDHPVTLLDAVRRRDDGLPVIQRNWEDAQFVMWLSSGDSLLVDLETGSDQLVVITGISDGAFDLKLHDDARTSTEIRSAGKAGGRLAIRSCGAFRALNPRKVKVSPLGEVTPADE